MDMPEREIIDVFVFEFKDIYLAVADGLALLSVQNYYIRLFRVEINSLIHRRIILRNGFYSAENHVAVRVTRPFRGKSFQIVEFFVV